MFFFGRLSSVILGAFVSHSLLATEPPKPGAIEPLMHVCARKPLDLLPDPGVVAMWRQYFSIASNLYFWHGRVLEDEHFELKIIAPTSPNTSKLRLPKGEVEAIRQNLPIVKWASSERDFNFAFRINGFYMTMTTDLRSLRHMLRAADNHPLLLGITGIEA